jgi:hypothetical protein
MNGKALYELYRKQAPRRGQGSSHAAAYWDGFDGRPCKFVRTSYGWWAYKAGRENRRQRFCKSVPCPYDAKPVNPGGYCAQCQRDYDKAAAGPEAA